MITSYQDLINDICVTNNLTLKQKIKLFKKLKKVIDNK